MLINSRSFDRTAEAKPWNKLAALVFFSCFFGSRVICWVPVVCLYNFFCYISLFVLRAEKLKLSKYRAL